MIHVQSTGTAVLLGTVAAVVLAASMWCSAATATPSRPGVEDASTPSEPGEYRVHPGDTLWSIAGRELGDPHRWPEIARLSASIVQTGGVRLVDPDLIQPGWTLVVPGESVDLGPVPVLAVSGATAVAAGENHTCAVVAGGKVACWGSNDTGQLGYITTEDRSATPVMVTGASGATAVAAGDYHSCAVLDDGQVACWGENFDGQLGRGTSYASYAPVSGVSGATAVSASDNSSCAVLAGGQVSCWGAIGYDEDDDEEVILRATPVLESGATAVTSSDDSSCAVLAGGQVTCWGTAGEDAYSATQVLVPGVSGATGVASGAGHTCALIRGGKIACWGSNGDGQLGDGTTKEQSATPVLVSGVSGATALAAGDYHSCAVIKGGKVACWGWNEFGQLGDGTTGKGAYSNTPVIVPGVSGATRLAAGRSHSCAVLAGGRVTCWGWNGFGQLGAGSLAPPTASP